MTDSLVKYLTEKRFIAVLISVLFAFILMWNGKIADGIYQMINISVVLGFIGGEVFEKNNKG
jgi:hypothetical protein